MASIRIFVSYDGDHDSDLHDLLEEQSKKPSSGFEFSAASHGAGTSDAWAASSRTRIRAADEVVVICGEHTNESPRVAAELRIAREEGTPFMLLWGRRERMCTKPEGARSTDPMYSWTREILASQMAETLRNAKPIDVPENLKRVR